MFRFIPVVTTVLRSDELSHYDKSGLAMQFFKRSSAESSLICTVCPKFAKKFSRFAKRFYQFAQMFAGSFY